MNSKNKILQAYLSVIVILGQSMHFIQAWKIFDAKSSEDVSLASYLICLALLLHWIMYGIFIRNKVLVIAEALGIIGVTLVITGICLYS